jgi:U11/U12 small nuclear ribonucleoprotein 65 kDa protein
MVPARARHIDRSASDQQQGPAPAGAATLLVRHLPEAITQEMLSRLFSHYGATSVRPCSGGKYLSHLVACLIMLRLVLQMLN